jgi:Ras GTPase-activating protein 3
LGFALNYCRLIECSDLTIKNGNCDPFAIVTMCYSNSKEESKRTKVKKKTVSPHFDEVLVFEVGFDFECSVQTSIGKFA